MKRILCYGDSNTWGYIGTTGERYPEDVRWTGVLQKLLGPGYTVIEEGLNGRTTVRDDPDEDGRNGETALFPCLNSHKPLDLVVTMLGTNDVKPVFAVTPSEIAAGMERLVEIILHSGCGRNGAPTLLLVSPPPIAEQGPFKEMFSGGTETCRELHTQYEAIARKYATAYLDGALHAKPSREDGVHLGPEGHRDLAEAIAKEIQQIFQ